jgi:hypothetical protein
MPALIFHIPRLWDTVISSDKNKPSKRRNQQFLDQWTKEIIIINWSVYSNMVKKKGYYLFSKFSYFCASEILAKWTTA